MLLLEADQPKQQSSSKFCSVEIAEDRGRWSSSVLIGLAFAGLALIYSLLLDQMIRGGHFWFYPTDVWSMVDAGRYVAHGALGYVYQGTSGSYALPLSFVLIAPVSGVIDHFGLVEGAPFPVAHPNAWLVVAPYILMFGIVVLHAAPAGWPGSWGFVAGCGQCKFSPPSSYSSPPITGVISRTPSPSLSRCMQRGAC